MYLMIREANGGTHDAVVLVMGRDCMRVALRGNPDVVEFRRFHSEWFNHGGRRIEFDAVLSDGANRLAN